MYYWKDTIDLIKALFDVQEMIIAQKLNISKSAFSKKKNGKQASTFSSDEIYELIFDPENKKSLLKSTADSCLEDMKMIIGSSFPKIREELEDCWESEDYKEFVFCLLDRTKNAFYRKPVSEDKTGDNEADSNVDTTGDKPVTDDSLPESSIVITFIGDEDEPICVERSGIFDVHIYKKDRICATCAKWKGDVKEAKQTPDGVYGICKIYNNREQLSTGGGDCRRYTPNMALLSQQKLLKQSK